MNEKKLADALGWFSLGLGLAETLATHRLPLEEAPKGYHMFKHKEDGCVRSVFVP